MYCMAAAERYVDNPGRVQVHQGAEAEGGEAEPGDRRLRARLAQQTELPPHGIARHS
jgi:hypothetical protein